MSKAELIEALADIEHQRWRDWQKYLHSKGWKSRPLPGSGMGYGIGFYPHDVQHWDTLIATDYADLPEHSKQSDRDQVARYLPLIVEFVADWLEKEPADGHRPSLKTLAEEWREEMS